MTKTNETIVIGAAVLLAGGAIYMLLSKRSRFDAGVLDQLRGASPAPTPTGDSRTDILDSLLGWIGGGGGGGGGGADALINAFS